jgi:hypothetical protein
MTQDTGGVPEPGAHLDHRRRRPDQGAAHIDALVGALGVLDTGLLDDWGRRLAAVLSRGAPNPLADACDEAVCVYPAGARALSLTATVQEAHQVALHLICLSCDGTAPAGEDVAGEDVAGEDVDVAVALRQRKHTRPDSFQPRTPG